MPASALIDESLVEFLRQHPEVSCADLAEASAAEAAGNASFTVRFPLAALVLTLLPASNAADAVYAAHGFDDAAWAGERAAQSDLVRDIFGNPFRPVALDPSWLTPAVTALARAIYDDRAFDRVPDLADVLERAGCADADVLAHCHGAGPHVRGCWVVDLLLGKS